MPKSLNALPLIGLLVAFVATFPLSAQEGFGPPPGGPMGEFGPLRPPLPVELLSIPEVRNELDLSDDQSDKVSKTVDDARNEVRALMEKIDFGALMQLEPDAVEKMFKENQETLKTLGDKVLASLPDVLTEKQVTRLRQLIWQRSGLTALLEEKVRSTLAWCARQERIRPRPMNEHSVGAAV